MNDFLSIIKQLNSDMKRILLFAVALFLAVALYAAKAYRGPVVVSQPDGTKLTVLAYGDEDLHWHTTTDGVLLAHVGNYFYVAIVKPGELEASEQVAHEIGSRSEAEKQLIARQDKSLFFSHSANSKRMMAQQREPIAPGPTIFPHTGEPKAVVILVQFSDLSFTVPDPQRSFQQYLNGEGHPEEYGNGEAYNYGSVKQYFTDMSGGQFKPQFDIYGPVTVSNTMAYYGQNSNGQDIRYRKLVQDACDSLEKNNLIDFSQYDSDGDNNVDLVYVVYAGYGESFGGASETLWPKSFNLNYPMQSGLRVGRCGINNELMAPGAVMADGNTPRINGIGLFCHEFSHCLGLPDFYPTTSFSDSTQYDNQAMEDWDLMDNGEYTNNGYCPTAYTAWEREAMDWITLDTLEAEQQVTLQNIDEGGRAYRIMNDADDSGKEYYIVQNIQNTGWNTKLKGHGMLVYHVKYNASTFSLSSNTVNNVAGSPGMAVIPADGLLRSSYLIGNTINGVEFTRAMYYAQIAGDAFPGTSSVVQLTDESGIVNYAPWTGGQLNKPIYNIAETDGVITFDYLRDFTASGISPVWKGETTSPSDTAPIYSVDGRYVGTDPTTLPKGVYIRNHRKFVIR